MTLARRIRPAAAVTALAAAASLAVSDPASASMVDGGASSGATSMSVAFWIMGIVAAVLVIGLNVALFGAVRRFRHRRVEEVTWMRAPAGLQARIAGAGAGLAALVVAAGCVLTVLAIDTPDEATANPASEPLHVQAVGQQWIWRFGYPGGSGRGQTFREVFSYETLTVPTKTPIALTVTSTDVVHSFWVPALGRAVDAVPGTHQTLNFTVDQPGVFKGHSAVLSGNGYPTMRIVVRAVPKAAYQRYIRDKGAQINAAQRDVQKALGGQPNSTSTGGGSTTGNTIIPGSRDRANPNPPRSGSPGAATVPTPSGVPKPQNQPGGGL